MLYVLIYMCINIDNQNTLYSDQYKMHVEKCSFFKEIRQENWRQEKDIPADANNVDDVDIRLKENFCEHNAAL